jgi:hypothetical protein
MRFLPRTLLPTWLSLAASLTARADYAAEVLSDSPMAFWRLGETGLSFSDATGNGHHGTADAPLGATGEASLLGGDLANGAIRLSNDARIIVPGWDKFTPASTGYSVEFWIRPETLPTACCGNIVGDGESGGDFYFMNYLLGPQQGAAGTVRSHFSFANTPVSLNSAITLAPAVTYHVVSTWEQASGTANIFINGLLRGTVTTTTNLPSNDDNQVFIGRDNREAFTGISFLLDEVAFYDKPLEQSRVARHFNAGFGLGPAHRFTFDEASSGTQPAIDSVTGAPAAFVGAATRGSGLLGSTGALTMSNTNGGVSMGNSLNLGTNTGLSITALVDGDWSGVSGDYDEIFRKEDGGNRILFALQNDSFGSGANPPVPAGPVLSLGLNIAGVGYQELDMPLDGLGGRPTVAQLNDGVHLLGATYDVVTGTKAIWFDGVLIWSTDYADGSAFAFVSGSGADAFIGATSGGGEPWTGAIDDFRIYNRALSETEMQALVPEPGAVLSLLGGSSVLLVRRRRRARG